jgi:hypothetical protein
MLTGDTAHFLQRLQQMDDDPLEQAERLAEAFAGESFQHFCRHACPILPHLPAATLAALSAELFARHRPDAGTYTLALAHEARRPPDQRRSPHVLLADITAAGFRAPSTQAQRRAAAAFTAAMQEPPRSPDQERAAWRDDVREQVIRTLDASRQPDFLRPEHRRLLEAVLDADLDDEMLAEAAEVVGFYALLAAQFAPVTHPLTTMPSASVLH